MSPCIMGIVNLTPDSFWEGSRHATASEAFQTMERMLDAGAAMIDLGAASSRPGTLMPTMEEEWARLQPVLQPLRRHFPQAAISIDSFHSEIVRRAYDLIGPFTVNDISAGEDDAQMLTTAGALKLPFIAMHKRGRPDEMTGLTDYSDLAGELRQYFTQIQTQARAVGIPELIIDPGFGFAKTTAQNYELLGRLPELRPLPSPAAPTDALSHPRLLVGISRKSMVYKPLGITPQEALPATTALHLYALQQGVDILRAHDVREAVQALKLYQILSVGL